MIKPGHIAPPPRSIAKPIASVLRLTRAHFADGGDAPVEHRVGGMERWHVGPIKSHVAGRTDHIPLTVPPGAYVIPADVVSGMGQGNTEAGHIALVKDLGLHEQHPQYARGGGIKIMAAGGEHVISPSDVRKKGKGDLSKGHDFLDRWVLNKRKHIVKTVKALPGPKKRD